MRFIFAFAVLLFGAVVCVPGQVVGDSAPKVTINEADIYLGDVSDFSHPATVDVDAVYANIPEYREIVDRNMDEKNPRYLFLLRKASFRFRKAVQKTAEQKGFDLIGGEGSIEVEGSEVPDITALVIRNLPR